ncbi:MAG TPA: hypothetical protein VLS47_09355 [Gallionella sp.]|nr:hypothetical protein [Gallionella sp.]
MPGKPAAKITRQSVHRSGEDDLTAALNGKPVAWPLGQVTRRPGHQPQVDTIKP